MLDVMCMRGYRIARAVDACCANVDYAVLCSPLTVVLVAQRDGKWQEYAAGARNA